MPALDRLFDQLLHQKGSDLHLAVGYPPMIRRGGDLQPVGEKTISRPQMEGLLFELLDEERKALFLRDWELDFAYAYENHARFRANYLFKTTGPGAVFRVIPSVIQTPEELGLPPGVMALAERRAGLVLVTGPTGSGKSTTLAAMISHINRSRAGHILTIEDPVEFVHEPIKCQVTHREVGFDTPTFADAIRSAVRENADVILVGELRGAETMRLALQLASFGILIFATVHTNSAAATIERFVNAFPSDQQPQIRGLLSDSLAGIVAQQLLKRADGSGRIAAHEVLVANPAVAAAIREAKTSMLASLIQSGAKQGMQTMDSTLEKLLRQGFILPLEALEKAQDKESFLKLPEVAAAVERAPGR